MCCIAIGRNRNCAGNARPTPSLLTIYAPISVLSSLILNMFGVGESPLGMETYWVSMKIKK
uniref:Uncharacterized protein n=1 Tax=Cannabis sativa TaxID=3483 RepID=A0A803R883_CANSA